MFNRIGPRIKNPLNEYKVLWDNLRNIWACTRLFQSFVRTSNFDLDSCGIFAAVSCCTKYPIVGFIHVCIENEEKRLPQIPINCVSPFDVHERTLRTSMRSQQPHSHALTKRIFQLCDALIDIPWAMLSRTEHMAMCLRFKCILYNESRTVYILYNTIQTLIKWL